MEGVVGLTVNHRVELQEKGGGGRDKGKELNDKLPTLTRE